MHIFNNPPRQRALELLAENGLPTSDLALVDFEQFLGCGNETDPDGVVGLEFHGSNALLRSLAVRVRSRAGGCGRFLVHSAEQFARTHGIENLYLLTETAEKFFVNLGYERVGRETVPESIQKTKEFSLLCPGSAVAMKKELV